MSDRIDYLRDLLRVWTERRELLKADMLTVDREIYRLRVEIRRLNWDGERRVS